MKQFAIALGVLMTMAIQAQVKDIEPEIFDYPNLQPDTIKKLEEEAAEYQRIVDEDIPYEKLTAHQRYLFENEMMYELGPYSTAEFGCSWYCATEPKGFSSTSQLDPSGVATYGPSNIHDFDLRTAWVEGKSGFGISESVSIEFLLTKQLFVTHIEIYNGYCKSESAWKDNSRVKTLALMINGSHIANLHLSDTYKKQRFSIGTIGGEVETGELVFTFKILDVYPGYKYEDTAISEINFDGTGDH